MIQSRVDMMQNINRTEKNVHGLSPDHISHSIDLARILLVVGLVFLHYGTFPNSKASSFQGLDLQEHTFATWANSAVLFFFLSAVPVLSIISGWLFFAFAQEAAWPSIFRRMRRRVVSLYFPLVVWNAAVFGGAYAVFTLAPNAMQFDGLNIDFATADWKDFGNAVFAVTHPPIAFQFWFVRDLLVTALVSPVLWLGLRFAPWLGAAGLGAAWLTGTDLVIFFRPDIPFFFYLGGLLRQKRLPVVVPLSTTVLLVAVYITLASVRALAPYVIDFKETPEPLWLSMATNAMRLFGVVGCWGALYRMATTRWGRAVGSYAGLAFFLHSAHWPLLALIKSVLWPLMPVTDGAVSDGWMLAHYAVSVLLTTGIGLGAGLALASRMPGLFALMNGGRLLEPPVTRRPVRPLVTRPQES